MAFELSKKPISFAYWSGNGPAGQFWKMESAIALQTILQSNYDTTFDSQHSLRSKRFRLVSEQIKTEERDFGFGCAGNETGANEKGGRGTGRHDRPSGRFSKSRGLSASVSFLSFPPPPRCFWLSFLVCSRNGQKRLLRRQESKENCFKNLTHFLPDRIPPSCTNKLTINCSTLQRRLKFHCFTLRRRKMRLERFIVGSSFTLHLNHVYVKQANLTIKPSLT